MRRLLILSLAILIAATGTVMAAPARQARARAGVPAMEGAGDLAPFERNLFPAELVLRHQIALGLTDEQVSSLKKLVQETQGRVIDLKTDLARVTERLQGILEPARIDEAAALSAAEEAMRLEAQVKREHMSLLVRVKNLLTEEQQGKLQEMRPRRPAPVAR